LDKVKLSEYKAYNNDQHIYVGVLNAYDIARMKSGVGRAAVAQ
jgi:hypothetical protein